jgi:hypothetical protein
LFSLRKGVTVIGNSFEEDFREYDDRGETGFRLRWRKEHKGEDPPNAYLEALRVKQDNKVASWLLGVLDAIF